MNESTEEFDNTVSSGDAASIDVIEQIDSLNEQAMNIRRSDTKRAVELTMQARHLAETHSYDRGIAYSLRTSCSCHGLTGNFKVGLEDGLKAFNLFKRLQDKHGMAKALNCLGRTYDALGEYSKAIESHSMSLHICEGIDDRLDLSTSLHNMGSTYFHLGDYAQALDYFQQSLGIKTEIKDMENLPRTLHNLGAVHEQLGEHEKAINYYFEAARMSHEIEDTEAESMIFTDLGEVYRLMGDNTSALECHMKALVLSHKNENRYAHGVTFINLGKIYQQIGEYEKALDSYRQGLQTAQHTGHRLWESEAFIRLGELFLVREEYIQAIAYLSKALIIAEEIGSNENIFRAYLALSQVYEKQGDFAQSLIHHKAFYDYRQKVFGEEAEKKLKRVMIQAEVEKAQKEAKIYRLKHVELASRIKELEEALSRAQKLQGLLRMDIQTYEFGPFRLEAAERRLLRDSQTVPLSARAFDLLLLLVQNTGHLIQKEEIMREVWPESFVEENNLTVSMSAIRKALGEAHGNHLYIQTVPKRGYRFVAKVKEISGEEGLAQIFKWNE